jgi:hypothetical protein
MTAPVLPELSLEGSLKNQRTAAGADTLAHSFLDNLFFVQGRSRDRATVNDLYMALAHTVRDRLVDRWIQTVLNYRAQDVRVVCYLSAEFLTGPHRANNLINLGIYDQAEEAMRKLGLDLEVLIEQRAGYHEPERTSSCGQRPGSPRRHFTAPYPRYSRIRATAAFSVSIFLANAKRTIVFPRPGVP